MIFRRVFSTALAAGAAAGLALALLQWWWVVPLIREAEVLERSAQRAAATIPAAAPAEADIHVTQADRRTAYTVLGHVVTGIGFALVLVGCVELRGRPLGVGRGLLWGLAGYGVFVAAPALGLPPELPGSAAAPLELRQVWWLSAVTCSAAGLALLVFGRGWPLRLAGLALLVLPHAIGAPHASGPASAGLPEPLTRQFKVASLATLAVFWLLLGALVGMAYGRRSAGAHAPGASARYR